MANKTCIQKGKQKTCIHKQGFYHLLLRKLKAEAECDPASGTAAQRSIMTYSIKDKPVNSALFNRTQIYMQN